MHSLSRCRNVKKLSHAQLCYFLILNKLEACLGSVEDWNWFGGVQRQQIGIYIKKNCIYCLYYRHFTIFENCYPINLKQYCKSYVQICMLINNSTQKNVEKKSLETFTLISTWRIDENGWDVGDVVEAKDEAAHNQQRQLCTAIRIISGSCALR